MLPDPPEMRLSESIATAYFAYLILTALILRLPAAKAARVILTGAAATGTALWLASLADVWLATVARDWLPGIDILVGYWLSGLLFITPSRRAEERLAGIDRGLFARAHIWSFLATAPRPLLEGLELTYLCCYLVVPAGFAMVYFFAPDQPADQFWTVVLVAVYGCYGMLPWIPTRPPRALEGETVMDRRGLAVRRLNLRVLQHGSIQVNTFPSGHSAGALASALALSHALPIVGCVFGVIAISIAAASVLGRYHYAADAVLGALLALAAWLLVPSA